MFKDEVQTCIDCPSTWGKTKSVKTYGTQTSALLTNDISSQSYTQRAIEIQTDTIAKVEPKKCDEEMLGAFLQDVEEMMSKALTNNTNSKAFKGLENLLRTESSTATTILTLNHAPLQNELSVQSVSWNASGSVVGVAYGKPDHDNWCTHKGYLCTWNIDRGKINTNKADQTLDLSSCLMCVEFHPALPNMCAGGAFNGQVTLWDLSKEEPIETVSCEEDGHHEPVSQICWTTPNSMLTAAMDGKVLKWDVTLSRYKPPQLTLAQAFLVTGSAIPRSHPAAPSNRKSDIGGTSLSCSQEDPTMFVVGTESGLVLKCSTLSNELPMDKGVKVQFRSPVTLVYSAHSGPVYDTHFSPKHRNLFLTASTDATIRLYNALQPKPFQVLEPVAGYIFAVRWSTARPLVFAAATSTGALLVYDLKKSRVSPVLQLVTNTHRSPAYTLAFNGRRGDLLCTGDAKGTVKVWKLSEGLVSALPGEEKLLSRIAASSYD